MDAAHRLGHRHRRGDRAPVGGAGCHRGAADLFAPGDRLQSRSVGAELDSGDQRDDADSRQPRPVSASSARRGGRRSSSRIMRASGPAGCAAGGRRRRTVYVAMHSFTPVFKGESRAMQVGVLYNRDARLARDHAGSAAGRGRSGGGRQRALRGERRHRLRRAGACRAARPAACRDRDPPGPDRGRSGAGGMGGAVRAAAAGGDARLRSGR